MNKWLKFLVIPLLIAIVGAVFYNKVYVVKSTFSVIKPSKGDLEVGVRGIGNVDAKNIYAITAQTGGKIEEIFFDEGMWVKKGDLLLSIDAVDLPMQSDETKLSLKKAQYEENALKSNLDSLEAQKKLIEATYNRYAKLLEQKFASQAEYDKAKSDLQNIEAQMNAAKAQIASSKSEQLRLQKSIEAIDEKLKRLKIYAPIDGYIVSKEAEKASYVLASSTIFKIVDPKTLWVKVNIDERLSNQVKLGQKAYIKLRSQPQNAIEGTIERIVAMSNLVTLEREVAVNFKNIPTPFYINEQAEVNIVVARHKDVIKIPLRLIVMKDGKKGVWTADQNNAYFKEISLLAQNDDEAAIASGIEADTELLIYNSSNKPLSEGMKIFR
jgi:RND family efflux transporter MFP subunit